MLLQALPLAEPERAGLEAAARGRIRAPEPWAATPVSPRLSPGGPLAPPFVGRARELALLERHRAGEGPPVLLLAGEPGIGKSRLLDEATTRALREGWTVVRGGCQRRGGQEAYAPFVGALQRHLRGQQPATLRAALQGCAWLVRLLPELADGPIPPLPPWTRTAEQERRLMDEAVARFLANVAGPAGTLLVLDDLQWAGADALDLLATLVRSGMDPSLRVVGAFRDTEVQSQHPLSVLLADLAPAGLVTWRVLGPLAPDEAAQLLAELLGGTDGSAERCARVLQRTGGVPFFLVSCAQGLRLGDGEEVVPWDVAQSVRQRVATLPEVAGEVLRAGAVVGRVVPVALLLRALARPEEEVYVALEAAHRARLLQVEGQGYQFAHDVIREVLEEDVAVARRAALHLRIAQALEQGTGELPVEALAFHYGRSGEQNKALLYLERAGDRARLQYAYAAAEDYYRELSGCAQGLGWAREEARAREKLGTVLAALGHYNQALAELAQAAQAYSSLGDAAGMCRAAVQIGWTHFKRGTPQEGLAYVQPLLGTQARSSAPSASARASRRRTPQVDLRDSAALCMVLAHLYWARGLYGESLVAAERAVELACRAGAQDLLAEAKARRGSALLKLSRVEEGCQALEEASALAETTNHFFAQGLACLNLMMACQDAGEFDLCRVYALRYIEACEQEGDPTRRGFGMIVLGHALFLLGEWSEAHANLTGGAEIVRSVGASYLAAFPPLYLGQLQLAGGDWEAASCWLEECVALAEPIPQLMVLRSAQGLLAERDLLEGQPAAALARLVPLLDRPGLEELDVTALLPTLAWAHLGLGELAEAGELLQRASKRARASNHRLALVEALRVQALMEADQGHWEEATRALEEGLSLARAMPYPYAEARLLHVHGQLCSQQGERGQARERLEAALAIFRRLGACKDAERAEQVLTMRC